MPDVRNDTPCATILVVEDDALIRMMIAEALRDEGFAVMEAESADVALAIVRGGDCVDIVFTDVRMPGTMDGIQLAVTLRHENPELPVIATSGYVGHDTIPKGLQFLPKPYSQDAVVGMIRNQIAY